MRTVGEILKNKRLEKKLSLTEIESAIKIREKYLQAIENNDFGKIVGGASTTKGFIRNYGEFLGFSSNDLLAIFRRDFLENETGQIIPRGMVNPLDASKLRWTPKMTIIGILLTLFLGVGGYFLYQYSSVLLPPKLEITLPKEGEKTDQNFVKVIGKTDSDATLFINQELKIISRDGAFSINVSLNEGENEIVIESVSRRGQKNKIVKTVYFEPQR